MVTVISSDHKGPRLFLGGNLHVAGTGGAVGWLAIFYPWVDNFPGWWPAEKNSPVTRYLQDHPTILVGGWTNPVEKYAQVKLDHFPRDRGENSKNNWKHLLSIW